MRSLADELFKKQQRLKGKHGNAKRTVNKIIQNTLSSPVLSSEERKKSYERKYLEELHQRKLHEAKKKRDRKRYHNLSKEKKIELSKRACAYQKIWRRNLSEEQKIKMRQKVLNRLARLR